MSLVAGKLYYLICEIVTEAESSSMVSEDLSEADLWHRRLGHSNGQQHNTVVERGL